MSYGLLSPEQVADRRQVLNDEAYFSILKALQASGAALPLTLSMKLRKELNISPQQQKMWLDELKHAQMTGQLYVSQPSRAVSATYAEVPAQPMQAQPESTGGRSRKGSKQQASIEQQQAQHQQAYLQQQHALLQQQQQRMQQAAFAQQQPGAVSQSAQQVQQLAQAPEELDAEMIGYKVEYYWTSNRVWQEGVITRYVPPNICVTFNMGSEHQVDEWIKWEQSAHFKMLNEQVSADSIKQYRIQQRLYP